MPTNELIRLLNNQWCTAGMFQKISSTGRTTAYKVFRELRENLITEGYWLPDNKVPMKKVVELLKIDIKYLKEMEKIAND